MILLHGYNGIPKGEDVKVCVVVMEPKGRIPASYVVETHDGFRTEIPADKFRERPREEATA